VVGWGEKSRYRPAGTRLGCGFAAVSILVACLIGSVLMGVPAVAACVPPGNTISSGDTVTCSGTDTVAVGDGSQNNVTVNVLPGATLNVSGGSAINLQNTNTITNAGNISVDTGAGIDTSFFSGNGNVVTNIGTIRGTADGAFGINVNNANIVINNGLISVLNNATGINVNDGNTVINNGTIVVLDTVGAPAALGISGNNNNNVTNAGTISVGSNGSYGIFMGADGGGNSIILNSGTITGGSLSFGIGVTSNYIVNNTGTIALSNGGSAIQLGGGNTATNSGTIAIGGLGIGFDVNGVNGNNSGGNTITNSGSVLIPNGFSVFGFTNGNTVTNTGYLQGTIELLGDNNVLTNKGTLIAGDPSNFGTAKSVTIFGFGGGAGGTLINDPSGTFAIRVSPNANDSFGANNVILNGGRLQIVVTPGLYAPTTVYSSATTGSAPVQSCGCSPPIAGQFDTVVSSSPFFTATPDYTNPSEVDVTLTRYGFGSVPGSTRNQMAVGGALEPGYSPGLDPTSVAGQFYANLLAATSIGVLDNLSGEGTAALQNASFGAGSQFNNATLGQLLFGDSSGTTSIIIPPSQYAATPKPRGADAFDSVLKASPAPVTQTGRWRLWTVGFGAYRSIDGNASPIGSASQTIRNYGGAFGFDYQAAPDLLLGFAAGGSEANVSVPDRATTGRLTGGHVGVYGLKTWGAYYLAASANYARFDNSTTRTIAGVGPTESATGSFASDQLSARLELGWKRAFANYTLTPFVAIEPAALWAHGYTETSTTLGGAPGVLGLSFAPRTTTSLPTFLGVQADTRIAFANGALVSPYARVSWVHEFEPSRQVTATFVSLPGAAFTVDGARPARDSGRLDAGSKIQLDTTRSLFANVSGEWSGISQSYSATAGFKVLLQ
jgi:uncharacterized protein with beta-barrel porin domain